MSVRFDLKKAKGPLHDSISLATVTALRAVGDVLYLAGPVGTREELRAFTGSDLYGDPIARFTAELPEGHIRLWSPGGVFDETYAPGTTPARPPREYSIAKYKSITAFGREAVERLIHLWQADTAPKPKPALFLHLTHTAHAGTPFKAVFPLVWGETAPKAVVDYLLESAMAGKRLNAASISDDCGKTNGSCGLYGKSMVGVGQVESFVLGAKLDEVWTCK